MLHPCLPFLASVALLAAHTQNPVTREDQPTLEKSPLTILEP